MKEIDILIISKGGTSDITHASLVPRVFSSMEVRVLALKCYFKLLDLSREGSTKKADSLSLS